VQHQSQHSTETSTMKISLSDKLSSFLGRNPIQCHLDGAPQATGGGVHDILDPATTTPIAKVNFAAKEDVNRAVESALRAQQSWGKTDASSRAELLRKLAAKLDEVQDDLAQLESLDVGKVVEHSGGFDIPFGTACFRYFADICERSSNSRDLDVEGMDARVHRAPYGVCGFIFPWNFPFLLFCWGAAPALAAGNTVVIKASEVTPLTSLFIAELFEEVGFPKGVVNVVTGTGPVCGQALAEHPLVSRMSFTGSSQVGRLIGKICGENLVPAKLELGGKGAALILPDADISAAAEGLSAAITLNSGQVCCTATRWYVHDHIYDAFIEQAAAQLKGVQLGHGLKQGSQMGPLVSAAQHQRVCDYYQRGLSEGAKAIVELEKNSKYRDGYFVNPHLLSGEADNICYREEVFGPTAFVLRYSEAEAAVSQINRLKYGLANSVWTQDLELAQSTSEHLIAGNIWINAHNVFAYGLPYGGLNQSGIGGGVNSEETYNDYRRSTTIARPLA
jgi:aldehyde dehydrogenase (NAD+)